MCRVCLPAAEHLHTKDDMNRLPSHSLTGFFTLLLMLGELNSHRVLWAISHLPINFIVLPSPGGYEVEDFMGQVPFLPPDHQRLNN